MAKQTISKNPSEPGPGDISNPQTPEQFIESGWVHYSKKEFYRAEDDFKRALELSPDNPEIWYNLAMTQQYSGRKEEAIQSFNKSIEFLGKPDYPDQVRALMLTRLAHAHINRMTTGDWNMRG